VLMPLIATRRQTAQPNCRSILPLAEPMTEAQEMLLENRLLGNVGVFREIRFQNFTIRVARRRDVIYLADPSSVKRKTVNGAQFLDFLSVAHLYVKQPGSGSVSQNFIGLSERAYIQIWPYRSYIEMN